MKNKLIFCFLLSMFFLNVIAAVPYNAWWQKANSFYGAKDYDSAAFYYEKLVTLHPENAEIFYNLGNTYYRLNKIGLAVLNYERALRLKPDYKKAQDNLELTQGRISNRIQQSQEIFFVRWWQTLTKTSLANVWAIISLLLFLCTLSVFLFRKWNIGTPWMKTQVAAVSFCIFLCTLVLAYTASERKYNHDRAVVMKPDAALRDQGKSDKMQVLLPEGTTLKIEKEQAEWVSVKLPDGRSGWIHRAAIERI